MNSNHQFQLQYLRAHSTQKIMEAICVFLAALFVTALLPSLIVRYVYAGQALFEQPPVLDAIPVIAFVIAVVYFLYAVIGNIQRELKIRKIEQEMMGVAPRATVSTGSVSDLQAAMTRVERTSDTKTTRGRRVARRR